MTGWGQWSLISLNILYCGLRNSKVQLLWACFLRPCLDLQRAASSYCHSASKTKYPETVFHSAQTIFSVHQTFQVLSPIISPMRLVLRVACCCRPPWNQVFPPWKSHHAYLPRGSHKHKSISNQSLLILSWWCGCYLWHHFRFYYLVLGSYPW